MSGVERCIGGKYEKQGEKFGKDRPFNAFSGTAHTGSGAGKENIKKENRFLRD